MGSSPSRSLLAGDCPAIGRYHALPNHVRGILSLQQFDWSIKYLFRELIPRYLYSEFCSCREYYIVVQSRLESQDIQYPAIPLAAGMDNDRTADRVRKPNAHIRFIPYIHNAGHE